MNKNKRIPYIDIVRGLAMCLIVFGHTIVYSNHCGHVYTFLYSFHVALFFVISGFTFKIPERYSTFIKNKYIRIMLPYFIWSFAFLLPYLLIGQSLGLKSATKSSFDIFKQIGNILYGNGNDFALKQNSSLWFLPALFSMEVIYGKLIKILDNITSLKKHIAICAIQIFIGFISTILLKDTYLPWGINTAIQFGVFFYVGYTLKRFELLEKIANIPLWVCSLLIVGSLACFCNYKRVSAIDYSYGYYLLAIISGLSISIALMLLCKIIGNNIILEYIGKNTMGILVFHKVILLVCQSKLGVITSLLKDSNIFIEIMISIFVLAFAIGWSLIGTLALRRFIPFLLGERKRA